MDFESLLHAIDPESRTDQFKIHLATGDGTHPRYPDPLDAYFAGELDEWQSWQSAKNFSRERLITLIQLPEKSRWLFAGVFDVGECKQIAGRQPFKYALVTSEVGKDLVGRLIVRFVRTGRSSYRLAESCIETMHVDEITAEPIAIHDFPGFSQTMLKMQTLRTIVRENYPTWRSALGSVSGVYAIADRSTGRLYIGSATGHGGIWSRWSTYAENGHGGNMDLKKLLVEMGPEHADKFQFSILETADTKASAQDVLQRETHWKQALLSREHGHNAN